MVNGENRNKSVELALDTFIKLMRCTETVKNRVHQHLQKVGVTESQLAVLEVLFHKGAMNQRMIGEKILKSKSNMTTVLDNLQKAGLIDRKSSTTDKRQQMISLTDEGEQLISKLFPEHAKEIAAVFTGLTSDEQVTFGVLCKKLGQSVQAS